MLILLRMLTLWTPLTMRFFKVSTDKYVNPSSVTMALIYENTGIFYLRLVLGSARTEFEDIAFRNENEAREKLSEFLSSI